MWDGKTGAFKAFATLRIFGDGLQPAAISKALGLTASKCDVAESGFGTWSYSTHGVLDNLRPLEDQVLHILQLLEPRSAAIIALRENFATQVFCYFGSQSDLGGFHLSADTLARLARLQLDFDVDGYFCCDATRNA